MYFFLTDTCIGIVKSSGVRKFCSNSKFPDKSSAGLTRFDCSHGKGCRKGIDKQLVKVMVKDWVR